MPLLTIALTIIVIGVGLYLVNMYIPMDAKINKILNIAVVIAVVLWLANLFGLFRHLGAPRIGN